MLKCYILDDEQHAVDALKGLLTKKFAGQVQIVGSNIDPVTAIDEIDLLQPEVLFLDVEMPAMNGLEVIRHFPQRKFNIIFTTAHEKYALPALKAAAIDYLVKPLSPQDVYDALQKCMPQTMATPDSKSQSGQRITLSTTNEIFVVNTDDIIRVEADNNYSVFYFTNRPKLLISKTLKDFDELLLHHDFFRIHQSHLINMMHVESVQSEDGGFVVMKQGHKVEISRRRKAEFLTRLKSG